MQTDLLITGVTGLIGQHVLYELLSQRLNNQFSGKIHVLARDQEHLTATARVRKLLEGPYLPVFLRDTETQALMSHINVIEGDLRSANHLKRLARQFAGQAPLHIIHSAASTNLFAGKESEQDVILNNYLGTRHLLESFAPVTRKFSFISTAFSCGVRAGLIGNEFASDPHQTYRNPYEQYKARSELWIRQYCDAQGIVPQMLRPSVVCGRLMDTPLYYTSKFDVFYGFGYFFYKLADSAQQHTRITLNKKTGLNILPVDYVAKAIVRASQTDIRELNIVSSTSVPHREYVPRILEAVGFNNYSLVEEQPRDLNLTEKVYYKTAGSVFTPYVVGPDFKYDTSQLQQLMHDEDEPAVLDNFPALIGFAVQSGFVAAQ